jgi:hypothetical protein
MSEVKLADCAMLSILLRHPITMPAKHHVLSAIKDKNIILVT